MPSVIDDPRSNQAKAVVARHRNKQKALIAAAFQIVGAQQHDLRAAQVARLSEQLTRLELLIEETDQGKELAQLTAAHDRLFKSWCVLTDTKSPGVNKSSRRSRPAEVQPIADSPTPATDTRPLGWEYDGV